MERVAVPAQLLITIQTRKQHPSHGGELLPVRLLEEELAAVANHLPWPHSLLPGQTPGPTTAKGNSPLDFIET